VKPSLYRTIFRSYEEVGGGGERKQKEGEEEKKSLALSFPSFYRCLSQPRLLEGGTHTLQRGRERKREEKKEKPFWVLILQRSVYDNGSAPLVRGKGTDSR